MLRLIASAVVALIADAIGLIVAAWALDDMHLDGLGLVTAVIVFAIAFMLMQPLLRQMALKNAPALLGSTALVATLASLIVADLLTDGISISGFTTWVLATVIVWFVAFAAQMLLPFVVFKKTLAQRRNGDAA